MLSASTYLTLVDNHPIFFRISGNVYKTLAFFTYIFVALIVLSNENSFKLWNLVAFAMMTSFGVFIRRLNRLDDTSRRRLKIMIVMSVYSFFFKIISLAGVIWYNNIEISNPEYKNYCFRTLVLFNIFSYYDIFHLFVVCCMLATVYSGNKPRTIHETVSLNNSELIDYTDDLKGVMCTICLDEYENMDILRKTKCGHIYHDECVTPWFNKSPTCPVCRYTFTESNSDNESNDDQSSTTALNIS